MIVATWRGWMPLPDDGGGGEDEDPSPSRCPGARGPGPTSSTCGAELPQARRELLGERVEEALLVLARARGRRGG